MVNNHHSVTKSVTRDYLNEISTKGYDFLWYVADNGYEWTDTKYYSDESTYPALKDSIDGVPYDRDMILHDFDFSILETPREHIDFQRPWLVKRGRRDLWIEHDIKPRPKNWFSFQVPEHEYEPLQIHTLHRVFVSLRTDELETAVLKFANKYGWLGRDVPIKMYSPPKGIKGRIDSGESLYRWRREIERMGVLLAIWDLIRQQDNKLGQVILWHDSDNVSLRLKWHYHKGRYEISKWDGQQKDSEFGHINKNVASRTFEPDFFSEYQTGEFIGPAWYYLGCKINGYLNFIRPKLIGYHQTETEVTYVPRTLLDALWLLFMLEVQGKTKVARCQYCGNWFELKRSTKTYCSGNCRRLAKYYRDKPKVKGGKP